MLQRRRFLSSAAAVSAGFVGLDHFLSHHSHAAPGAAMGYGPLLKDKKGILDLPMGFDYKIISRVGDKMDDGLRVPDRADGMGAFQGPGDTTILVRNHENDPGAGPRFQFDDVLSLPPEKVYDRGSGKKPGTGGTTTLVVDNKTLKVTKQYMSLTGTLRNCAGGVTPWNSWITCEETVVRAGDGLEQDHGYCFEVPAEADGLATPVPIKAMGRFNHEAIAIDPNSGAVYLTEDRHDSLIYRYLPNNRTKLAEGGRLQVLVVRDQKGADTRNWKETGKPAFPIRKQLAVSWVDIDDVDSPKDDLRYRGNRQHGAAIFARGEGIFYGNDAIYWACTNGGRNKSGQIFRYVPSKAEGSDAEEQQPGMLELFVEPNDTNLLEYGDNLCISPWGDVIVCEDGKGSNFLVGITKSGELYRFGKVSKGNSEFAGSVFSSDGRTLFVNIQVQGLTLAITGPWQGA